MVTLLEALQKPQAHYLTLNDVTVTASDIVSADMGTAVITNASSIRSMAATLPRFGSCLVIAIENEATGAIAIAHCIDNWASSLRKLIKDIRRSSKEKLNIHLLGALRIPALQTEAQWKKELQHVIDTINATPYSELLTYDIDTKPHPARVAFMHKDGKAQLVRLSPDVRTLDDMEPILGDSNQDNILVLNGQTCAIESHSLPTGFASSKNNPYLLAWDGRKEEYQDPAKALGDKNKILINNRNNRPPTSPNRP